jgi:ATP-dependent Clp protease adaptor protein ClpS
MEFVVESLVEFFDYTIETATQLTVSIHENGQAIVAVLPFEIAEQKKYEVNESAREQDFPLQIKLEPDSK